jgi:hypothetical protein
MQKAPSRENLVQLQALEGVQNQPIGRVTSSGPEKGQICETGYMGEVMRKLARLTDKSYVCFAYFWTLKTAVHVCKILPHNTVSCPRGLVVNE